ncbi:bacteriocin [Vibrio cyclitrophicus]|uniref:bacteriocin n=1 Tax=Vibrio cyclitrophicus TaxID=47951 RepID=UPI0011B6C3DA|nr:bacteriocin [Vibrio cyclitrophicus]
MSWSLIQVGQKTKQNAMSSMVTLAGEEQKRNIANENLEQQHKQGVAAGVGAGASVGATIGSAVPGVGTVIGAGVGAVVGGLSAAFF